MKHDQMPEIRAVYFDYGGVLSSGGLKKASKEIPAAHFGLSMDEISVEDLDAALRQGQISRPDYFTQVSARYGNGQPPLTEELYIDAAKDDIFRRNKQVYTVAEKLREKGIITGIMSNVTYLNASLLSSRGLYEGFNPIVLSCNVGARKPDPLIYHVGLTQIGTTAEQVLMVDDSAVNLDAAQQYQMQTELADPKDPDGLVASLVERFKEQNGLAI